MKLAVIGRSGSLYDTAARLLEAGHEITLVVTAKEAPEYSRTVADFERLAASCGAQFVRSPKLESPEVAGAIERAGSIPLAVSANFPSIISRQVIDRFPLGILNAHAGDLPRYRGNACAAWAIINNETKIGLCVHKMVGGDMDSGDIIIRAYRDIGMNTRIGQVVEWIDTETPKLVLEAVAKLAADPSYILEKQSPDPADALRCYPRHPDDGRIDWRRTSVEILHLINASSEPYSGAFALLDGKRVTIWRAEIFTDQENWLAVPGQVAAVDALSGGIIVICGDGKLRITDVTYDDARCAPATIVKSIRKRLT